MIGDSLRQLVRERAHRRCEYCHVPDEFDLLPFQVDHVIAQQHLGPSTAENLAWACFACNHRKGPNLSSVDWETGAPVVTRLFNPRSDGWEEHFQWAGPVLQARTAIGRSTLHCLGINLNHRVALRKTLIDEGVFAR